MGKMGWNVQPALFSHAADVVQPHVAIHDFTEQQHPFVGDQGDEICPRLRIIVSLQADGSAMVAVWVIGHGSILRFWQWIGVRSRIATPLSPYDIGEADLPAHQLVQQGLEQFLQGGAARLLGSDAGIYRLQHAGDLALLVERGEGDGENG